MSSADPTAAERMRRYRKRQRKGVLMVSVEIQPEVQDEFERQGVTDRQMEDLEWIGAYVGALLVGMARSEQSKILLRVTAHPANPPYSSGDMGIKRR